jgi:hypothetical protein
MAECDSDGWVTVEKFLPMNLELVEIETEDFKRMSAWYFRGKWEGIRLKPHHVVAKWRKKQYIED